MAAAAIQLSTNHPSSLASSTYPFAASPDIIRSNQKDIHEISTLSASLTDILRRLYGSRFTHTYSSEAATLAHLLYFSLTTLIGNRTLGEEYTDVYQIEINKKRRDQQKLPAIDKRGSYILLSVLFPYVLGKTLPALRSWIRKILERDLVNSNSPNTKTVTVVRRIQDYFLTHLSEITSPAPIHALTLTLFYFTGSYYHLSKRFLGLRYVFSRQLSKREEEARVGYELLGLLLVIQIVVQGCLHVRNTFHDVKAEAENRSLDKSEGSVVLNGAKDSQSRIASMTNTPLPVLNARGFEAARYNLEDSRTMAWIQSEQQRKCTLCLEPMKDPSVATCGHVFCWTCILDWVRERAECPLCRQGILGQHVLPLRG